MAKKNLLLIVSDQHNKHMIGAYGNKAIKTPNLDELAQRGTVFSNAYTSCPLCAPARASLAIGDYASKYGFYDNVLAFDGSVKSWGHRLQENGVNVTTIGKLHFKSDDPNTGFNDQRIPLHIKNGVGDVYGEIRDKEITRPQFATALYDAKTGESDYIKYDKEVARRAVDYLKNEAVSSDKPFVLQVGFVSPHFPLVCPSEFADLYDVDSIEIPIQFDKSEWPHHPVIDDYRRYCCQEDVPEDVRKEAIRIYYGMCSFVDHQIGLVLEALKDCGLNDDTYVIYTSDHGDTMGEHGVFFKSTLYEGSVGIPMILSGPDVKNGYVEDSPVSLVDIYPSTIEMTGGSLNGYDKSLPGKSLLDTLSNPDLERSIYSEYLSFGFYTSAFMLRKGRYKYIHYEGERPQLFDLYADPDECNDLGLDSSYNEIMKDLEDELFEISDCSSLDKASKKAQNKVLDDMGGVDEFMKTFKPSLFSPIPDLNK